MSGLIARALGVAVASAVAATGCAGGNGDCRPTTPTIAFDSAHADNIDVNDIYLIDGDGTNRRVLVEDAWSPDWSPDGCSIAFVRDGVYVVSATGGRARRLTHDPPGASSPGAFVAALAAWSPDGDQIALELYGEEGPTAAPEGVYYIDVLNSGGSDRHRLVPFQAGEPSWSPGGDRIAVTRYLTIDTSDVYVVDAGGSNLQRLTRRSNRSPGSNSPSWSPDGSVIAFVRWPDQHNDLYTGAEIYLVDAAGGRPRRVTSVPPDSPGDGGPAWSPDGKRIAFARESTEGITDVYIVNRDGSALRRLTRTGDVGGYAWSPDGRTIVFSRAVETGEFAEADLYVAGADGRGLRRLTKTPRLTEDGPTWAPQQHVASWHVAAVGAWVDGQRPGVRFTAEAARQFLVGRHFLAPARSLEEGINAVLAVFRRLDSIQYELRPRFSGKEKPPRPRAVWPDAAILIGSGAVAPAAPLPQPCSHDPGGKQGEKTKALR